MFCSVARGGKTCATKTKSTILSRKITQYLKAGSKTDFGGQTGKSDSDLNGTASL
jgi:hypothetical protein